MRHLDSIVARALLVADFIDSIDTKQTCTCRKPTTGLPPEADLMA